MMDKPLKAVSSVLKNIQGGPKTTIGGLVLSAFSGYMMCKNGFSDLTYASVEVGLMSVGIVLFFLTDTIKPDAIDVEDVKLNEEDTDDTTA